MEELSLYLAKVIGIYATVMGLALITRHKMYKNLAKEMAKEKGMLLFGGAINLILGLLLVFKHNLWVADWRILITLLAWIMIAKGILLTFAPGKAIEMMKKKHSKDAMTRSGVLMVVFGLILVYYGFWV
jgi:uncharacterized protein YjeT (DUF2065 family)